MLGNCATGRLSIVMVPTITITMEITMATMGRLMKNFDIGLPSLRLCSKRLGVDLHAPAHLQPTLDDDTVAVLQPVRNNPLGADAVADFDGSDADFILVIHHSDVIAALQLRHCTLGY